MPALVLRILLVAVCVFLACPIRVHNASAGLDASWAVALNDAASRGLIHGRDVAFTYGPWSWVVLPMGANIARAMPWQFAMWALFGGLLAYLTFVRKTPLVNLAVFTLALAAGSRTFSDYGYAGPDLYLAFVTLLLLACGERWSLLAAVALSGALFLMKLTSGIFAASAIIVWAAARPERRKESLAVALAGIPASVALAYVLHEPSLAALLHYLRAALDISGGFSAAMSLPGETPADLRDAALITLCFAALAALCAWRKSWDALAMTLAMAGPLFLSFKHSFVRPAGHVEIFFTTAPLLLAAVSLVAPVERKRPQIAAVLALFAAVWLWREGLPAPPMLALHVADAPPPSALEADRIDGLPARETAVFPYEAAIPVASGVPSRPLAVVQAYQAYTRFLDQWNAESITKADQIVLHWDTVDGRHPFLDAPALTLAMLRHFDFDRELGPRMLLRRRASPRFREIRKTGEATLRIGETLRFPAASKPQLMRVDLRLSSLGRLQNLLWKLPAAQVMLSAPGGRVLAARLAPDVLANVGPVAMMPASLDEFRAILEQNRIADPYAELVIQAEGYEREAKVEYFEIADWPAVIDAPKPLDLSGMLNQGEARAARIDVLNAIGVASLAEKEVASVEAPNGYVLVKGWAFDFFEGKPASAVYLELDGGKQHLRATYGESRMDNIALFRNPNLGPTGFSAAIPASRLGADAHELRVVVVSPDGRKYATSAPPVRFSIKR